MPRKVPGRPITGFAMVALVVTHAPHSVQGRSVSIGVTGDVNFHPNLTSYPPEYPWGDLRPTLLGFDLLLINHESTAANLPDPTPNNYKYEDPMNYTAALLAAANVNLTGQANNHQFDFWGEGMNRTIGVLSSLPAWQQQGGLFGASENPSPSYSDPVVFRLNDGDDDGDGGSSASIDVAVFSLVAQLCHKDPDTGEDVLDSCTCGMCC